MTRTTRFDSPYEIIDTSNEACCSSESGVVCACAPLYAKQQQNNVATKHMSGTNGNRPKDEDRFHRFVGEVDVPESMLHLLFIAAESCYTV